MSDRLNGTVKWFNSEKGFGFIQVDGSSKDLFVHHSEITNRGHGRVSLEEGQKVSFEIGTNKKGENAVKVETL